MARAAVAVAEARWWWRSRRECLPACLDACVRDGGAASSVAG